MISTPIDYKYGEHLLHLPPSSHQTQSPLIMANSPPTNLYLIFLTVLVVPYAPGSAMGLHGFDVLGSCSWSNHSCSYGRNITGGLPIIHRLSPWAPQKLRLNFTSELERHQARVTPETGLDPRRTQNGNYLVVIGLGTPQKNFHMLLDTGSSLTWLQCEPCTKCHHQSDPRFEPALSSTYRVIPYTAEDCRRLGDNQAGRTAKGDCKYRVNYGDHDYTIGK